MGAVHSTHRQDDTHVQSLVGKPEGKRPFKRPRHRGEDNIKMDLSTDEFGV